MKRRRKIEPMALFWTIVLGFAAGKERSLTALRRAYERCTGATLVPSAFYDRFSQAMAEFFRTVAAVMMERLGETDGKLGGVLAGFKDVLLTDSTLVRVHDLLEKSFPASRTNHTKAAVKLHVVMSVKGGGAHSMKMTSGRQHDGPVLQVGRWVKDHLMLFDLGYFRYALFDQIDRFGGYFVSRLKQSANPVVVEDPQEGGRGGLVGRRLLDVLKRVRREELDLIVEVPFRRRAYLGRRSGAKCTLRLVGTRDKATGAWHLYFTNIPAEKLSARQVATVYACRWEIELLFKEMKSEYRLDEVHTSKRHIVEALLYATVLTLLVSRKLMRAVREKLRSTGRMVPQGRWGAVFAEIAADVLKLVLAPVALARVLAVHLEATLLHEALDPNLSRTLLRERVENGATW
ncbi:MAG: IS4 family transposase [Acidobacteria bacterium]|nr:IS4 family transposase [Acidobacteriota bacterium]